MKPRSLLVLLAVVLGLGAFVWFYERKLPSTEEAKAAENKVLAGVEADQVREVTIVEGGSTVRLTRQGKAPAEGKAVDEGTDAAGDLAALAGATPAEWRLQASGPAGAMAARADRTAVEGLLSSLLALEKARTLAAADHNQYGLAPPMAQVTLVTKDGKRVLEIGRELPGTEQRAVAIAGEPAVQVVASSFWSEVAKPAGEWRSRELFAGSRDDVERVTLQHGASRVLLARRGGEPWLEAPLADRADQERFAQLVDALTALQAAEFLDTPQASPAAMGLEPPADVIEVVRKGDAHPFRLELGGIKGEGDGSLLAAQAPADGGGPARYARVDGQLVTVKSPALDEALPRGPQDWRSRSWTSFAVYEVDKVEIADGKGKLVLTRDDADWKRGKDKIFYGTVSDLLGALADAKAESVLDAAAAKGLTTGAPALTATLVGSGGKQQTLTLWSPVAAGAPARSSGRDAVLLLSAGFPADLAQKVAAIRQAEPLVEKPTPTPS